jgi:nicotinamidase-related amidase
MKRLLFTVSSTCLLALFLGVSLVCGETPLQKQKPQTLLSIVGAKSEPSRLADSVLVIVDAQREYVDGKLRLDGIDASLKEASLMLERARKAGIPVIHVVQKGKPGGVLFNPEGPYAEIAGPVAPRPDEKVVTKTLPNAFAGTKLEKHLAKIGRKNLIVVGYMTHMCVSSTVRGAVDRGYRTTVLARATATRDLPAPLNLIKSGDSLSIKLYVWCPQIWKYCVL